jgi:hypothetical protein
VTSLSLQDSLSFWEFDMCTEPNVNMVLCLIFESLPLSSYFLVFSKNLNFWEEAKFISEAFLDKYKSESSYPNDDQSSILEDVVKMCQSYDHNPWLVVSAALAILLSSGDTESPITKWMTLAIEKNNRTRYWVLQFGCLERLALNLESSVEDVSIGAADVLKSIARKDEELQLRVASRCSAGLADMLRSKSQKKMLASAACTWNMITHNDPAKELVHERGFVPLLYEILTAKHHQYNVKHAAAGALVNLGNNKSCIATIRGLTDVEALLSILKDANSTGVLQCKVAELLGEINRHHQSSSQAHRNRHRVHLSYRQPVED